MPLTIADLAKRPNPLAAHYTHFRVAERLLLTGHSHQAWPDVALEGQIEAFTEAARNVDDKWERAAEVADRVRRGFAERIGARAQEIALAPNTHELVLRFLSALPLRERPRLVTTDGEFHTLRRQLDRLAEERVLEIVKVSAEPSAAIAERLIAAIDDRTAAVLVSSVLFGSGHIVPGLDGVAACARTSGAEMLVDAYHQVNVVPMAVDPAGLADVFVVGGGYKYCQLGEGNCFLRVPPGREHLRPVLTGWFAEFGRLSERASGGVVYGEGPTRWAGATYDPTSHFRAARVFEFLDREGLTPEVLREVSQHQVGFLSKGFDDLNLDPAVVTRDRNVPLAGVGGFFALRSPRAGEMSAALQERGVFTDYRGDVLRLGPAPYLSDGQLIEAIAALGEAAQR